MTFQEWAQIVGASIIGGLIATFAQFALEWWRVRRERRYRHFDQLTEDYRELFGLLQRLQHLTLQDGYTLDEVVAMGGAPKQTLADDLRSIEHEIDQLTPRMNVGMPQRTSSALRDLAIALAPIRKAVRSDDGASEVDTEELQVRAMLLRRATDLVEFHARWDVGHIDEPPRWIAVNRRLRMMYVPLRVRGFYVRNLYWFTPWGPYQPGQG